MLKRGRFIAGAVCAACGAADRIVVEYSVDGQRQRCIACGQTKVMENGSNTRAETAPRPALIASSRSATSVDGGSTGNQDEHFE